MKPFIKILACILFFFCSNDLFSISINELINVSIENNQDIKTALTDYEKSILTAKSLDGLYVPEISISSSSVVPKEYDWDELPDNFSSTLTYSQSLPGGTKISVESSYSFETINYLEDKYIAQYPNLSFSLSQSLLPFWVQGCIHDPGKLSLKQQQEYYHNQFLYVKRNVIQNVCQIFIAVVLAKNTILMNQNNIQLFEEQIDSLKILQASGNATRSKVLEIENQKWNAQQNLMSAQTDFTKCINNLKVICGYDFPEEDIQFSGNESIDDIIIELFDEISDPLEENYKLKIEKLKSERILEKQASAPVLNIFIQPNWTLDVMQENNWKDAWDDMGKPASWKAGIGINLTPMLSGAVKNNSKKYQLNYKDAENAYISYLQEKEFVKFQYKTLLNHYMKQSKEIAELYESALQELEDYEIQYKANAISKFDFDSVRVRVENCKLSKECVEGNVWLYEVLIKLNN